MKDLDKIKLIQQINLHEKKTLKIKEPPTYLNLQLKAIQNFPENQKVALYFCPAIKRYFSFVYGKEGVLAENTSIIAQLANIEDVQEIVFSDGSTMNVNEDIAAHILELYENTDDKIELDTFMSETEDNFLSTLEYCVKSKQ